MYNSHANEDLLPRTAPVPSATLPPDTIVKPSVPEVSIILGDQNQRTLPISSAGISNGNVIQKPIQSYSAWKKQCLPHVVYADEGGSSAENSPRNNIFPMKAPQTQTRHSMSPQPQVYTSPTPHLPTRVATPPLQQQRVTTVPQPQSFPIDNNFIASLKQALGIPETIPAPQMHQQTREDLLQSLQPQAKTTNSNVLTICAGTQTDQEPEHSTKQSNSEQFATKDDVNEILKQIQEMRTEQIHLMHYLKMAMERKKVLTSEVGTQCDKGSGNNQNIPIEEYRTTPKTHFNKQQSRTPQQNVRTPLGQNYLPPMLSKPVTEQSLVMNELAMKYLPSHKLSDLLQEIHTHENHSPLRMIDNVLRTPVTESPNDISNASYRYLKKYRLLPDEEENQDLDLDAIRNQPKFL